jgi:hypothetical protein
MSYGHVAMKVAANSETIVAELKQRGIPHRLEPRATGFLIPVVDDPEGNMVELFPNIDHLELPPGALCPSGVAGCGFQPQPPGWIAADLLLRDGQGQSVVSGGPPFCVANVPYMSLFGARAHSVGKPEIVVVARLTARRPSCRRLDTRGTREMRLRETRFTPCHRGV